jgi:transcription initiation factor TFIID subunit 5
MDTSADASALAELKQSMVLQYLESHGYARTLRSMQTESHQPYVTDVADQASRSIGQFLTYNANEVTPARFEDSYDRLKVWLHNLPAKHKKELEPVVFPVFVSVYLELLKRHFVVEAIAFVTKNSEYFSRIFDQDPQNREHIIHRSVLQLCCDNTNDETVTQNSSLMIPYVNDKIELNLSAQSSELLGKFLDGMQFMLLKSIIMTRFNEVVVSNKPLERLGGGNGREAKRITPVHWGILPETRALYQEAKAEQQSMFQEKLRMDNVAFESAVRGSSANKSIPLPVLDSKQKSKVIADFRHAYRLGVAAVEGEGGGEENTSVRTNTTVAMFTFFNAQNEVNCINVSEEADVVCAGMADSTVKVWEKSAALEDGSAGFAEPTVLVGHSGPVYSTSISPFDSGRFVLSGSQDSTIRLWSLETNSSVVCFKGHNQPVWDVQFSPLGFYFASGSHDGTMRLWRTDRIYPLRVFTAHTADVNCVGFHPNCNYVASGSDDETCRLFDVSQGNCVRVFPGHKGGVSSLDISPDGRFLASASYADRAVRLFDIGTGKEMHCFRAAHEAPISKVCFSRDNAALATAGLDGTVKLWSLDDWTDNYLVNGNGNGNGNSNDNGNSNGNGHSANSSSSSSSSSGNNASNNPTSQPMNEVVKTFYTKQTTVTALQFSPRNLLYAAGVYVDAPSY